MLGANFAFLLLVSFGILANVSGRIAPPPSTARKVVLLRGGGSAVDEISSLDWRYFAAGGICAAFSHGITTPIGRKLNTFVLVYSVPYKSHLDLASTDVVKTRMQTEPERYTKGVIHAAKEIVSQEGIGYLLAGLGRNLRMLFSRILVQF
jgi:hypothetical protein